MRTSSLSNLRFAAAAALVAAACAVTTACSSDEPVTTQTTPPVEEPIVLPGPDSVPIDTFDAPTTDGAVALTNLSDQIDSYRKQVERLAGNYDFTAGLVERLLTRTQFVGSYNDFAEALTLTDDLLKSFPEKAEAYTLRAGVLGAVHRFDEALELLDEAEALGADVGQQRETVFIAQGKNLKQVLKARRARLEQYPNFNNYTALATAHAAVGEYELADQAFLDALTVYNNVSPMAVAWVAFQRGVMWAEQAGRSDLAKPLYESALRRLPNYIVANVHLSELEVEADQTPKAVKRLDRVRTTTIDPEPTGYLAELLLTQDPETAEQHAKTATERYDQLLADFPEAFADHGSEFFSGPAGDDPARGLKLALGNLELRRNDRAFNVAIGAALAAGDNKLAQREARATGCK